MSNFIKIKPEILYAPMLASFGGGSSRGYGRGISGGVKADYWGTSAQGYSGYSGDLITFSPSYSYPTEGHDIANFHSGLSVFYDLTREKVFISYDTMQVRDLYNPSNLRRAIDYKTLSSTQVNIPPVPANGSISMAYSSGRGITIAFLNDAARTEVLVIGHTNQGCGYCYNPDTLAFMGKISPDNYGGTSSFTDWVGLAWDGDHLLVTGLAVNKLHAFKMPESLDVSSAAVLEHQRYWHLPATASYSLTYAGKDSAGSRRIIYFPQSAGNIYTNVDSSGNTSGTYRSYDTRQSLEIYLHATDASSVWGGPDRSHPTASSGNQQYGLGIDYKNLALVYGGYASIDFCAWPGSI